jgi:hypothetical protein
VSEGGDVEITEMEIIVLESAFKHGKNEEEIRHALRNAIAIAEVTGTELKMAVGPDLGIGILEVGFVVRDGLVVVPHAMDARPNYLRSVPPQP